MKRKHLKEIPKRWLYSKKGINWCDVSSNYILSEDFIEKYIDKVSWDLICIYQILSEEFIEKHKDRINFLTISRSQKLSENFIEKHFDKLNVNIISLFQKLSEDFIKKYKNRLNLDFIFNKSLHRNYSRRFKSSFGYHLIKTKRLFFRKKFLYV